MKNLLAQLALMPWLLFLSACAAGGPQRFRTPAPYGDTGSVVEVPTFGAAAGHGNVDGQLHVMEWVAKRTWHILGLPYERKDFTGPPDLKGLRTAGDALEITGTVAVGGVPLRNQVITCEIEQRDRPVLVVLRSTDAFGEALIELDLHGGTARARSVTVSRSMIGGQSHSSPMPEQSSNRIIREARFTPASAGRHRLKIETRGPAVRLWLDDKALFEFDDPDPAGGKFGFGSAGTVAVRDVQQWELIPPAEQRRREACLRDMHDFCKELDAGFDDDVCRRNRVATVGDRIMWTWPATGATAVFTPVAGGVRGTVRAGLYGDDVLVDGAFPDLVVIADDGRTFRPDPRERPAVQAEPVGMRMTVRLTDGAGADAVATVNVRFTVQTVWFWRVRVDGVRPRHIQAFLGMAPAFAPTAGGAATQIPNVADGSPAPAKSWMRHNNKAGLYAKILEPGRAVIGVRTGGRGELAISTTDDVLRFATVILPQQPLNPIGFGRRMVHFIRYPEGPVQHWRRRPSFQEYPDDVDLARFRGHGTDAMVWHHTWLSTDYRDREAFLLNEPEMKRATEETHRLGMAAIGYIGIVPGRSSLLRIEDTTSFGGPVNTPTYEKNWDLQDFTFYHVAGRWQEYLPWMTDHWCREYGLDGFYLDGGLAYLSSGAMKGPLHPEDADLSLDEMLHRMYYRVKKVFERHGARFGLETWGGLNYMVNGFYDCQMIGESFQEAPPEDYRDKYNALLTGTTFKMYGMRESSQNPYNIAMAAVCMSDIQVCSGNGAWGDDPDTTDTWARVRPYWDVIRTVRWDRLLDARPWYAQELVRGEGFYAGNYTEPDRVLIFLANRTEQAGVFDVSIDTARLPKIDGAWHARYVLGREGDIGPLGAGRLKVALPPLHGGPIGIELVPRSLTVAAVSMESRIRDVAGNLARIEAWVRRASAAGADLVLLPETAISGWWASREIRRYAEPLDGPSVRRLIRLAGELGVVIAVGMTEKNGDRVHIAHVLLDGHGVIGVHRKTELAPGEEKYWDPGDDADVFDVRGVRVGIAICYESVHPRICARLRAAGAEVILAPYANGTDPDELLNGKRPYPYARARENRVWYVACDAPAQDENGRPRRGAAYVIDPTGRLAAITAHDAVGENMIVYPLPPRVAAEPTPRRQSWAERGGFSF